MLLAPQLPGWALAPIVLSMFAHTCTLNRHLTEFNRASLAGFGFGFGAALVPTVAFGGGTLLTVLMATIQPASAAGWALLAVAVMAALPPLAVVALPPMAFLGILSILPMAALWTIMRHALPAPRIQDGTLCPGCGYSLVGNASGVCPECGRTYTDDELLGA